MVDERRAALVTGGGTGIGRATATRLASEGYRVAIIGRRAEPLAAVADAIGAADGTAVTVSVDVGTEEGARSAVDAAVEAFGGLHAVVCNHGVSGEATPVGEATLDGWESTLRVNLTGPFLIARAALPHLIQARGAIVTVIKRLVRRTWLGALLHLEGGVEHADAMHRERLRAAGGPR